MKTIEYLTGETMQFAGNHTYRQILLTGAGTFQIEAKPTGYDDTLYVLIPDSIVSAATIFTLHAASLLTYRITLTGGMRCFVPSLEH